MFSKKLINAYCGMLLLAALCSCQKTDFDEPNLSVLEVDVTPIGLTAVVSVDGGASSPLVLRPEPQNDYGANLFAFGDLSEGVLGPNLYLGLAHNQVDTSLEDQYKFTLKFFPSTFSREDLPTLETMEDFFFVGREFAFGTGVERVELGLLIPGAEGKNLRSTSSFTTTPTGTVRVEDVVSWSPEHWPLEEPIPVFRLIEFSFSGFVGVYDPEQAGGEIMNYVASRQARVEGTASLWLNTPR